MNSADIQSRGVSPRSFGLDLPEFDLTDRDCVLTTLLRLRPEVIINTAAFTQVDKAEQEPALCRRVNVDGVKHLVEACRGLDCTLVQISTDYVFGRDAGRTTPYRETDEPGPLGIYGQTKLDGERLAAQWSKHFVVRTCGLYGRLGPRSAGNFVATMLRLGAAGRPLRVVNDQHWRAQLRAARSPGDPLPGRHHGLRHVPRGQRWRNDLVRVAREVLRQAGLDVPIEPITTAEYGALAPRPAYSVLDTAQVPRPRPTPGDGFVAGCADRIPHLASSVMPENGGWVDRTIAASLARRRGAGP